MRSTEFWGWQEKKAWESLKRVMQEFLGNKRNDNFTLLVMLQTHHQFELNMSLKPTFSVPVSIFPNCGAVSDDSERGSIRIYLWWIEDINADGMKQYLRISSGFYEGILLISQEESQNIAIS